MTFKQPQSMYGYVVPLHLNPPDIIRVHSQLMHGSEISLHNIWECCIVAHQTIITNTLLLRDFCQDGSYIVILRNRHVFIPQYKKRHIETTITSNKHLCFRLAK